VERNLIRIVSENHTNGVDPCQPYRSSSCWTPKAQEPHSDSSDGERLGDHEREVTPALIEHYARRARGVGLVIAERSYVGKVDRLSKKQLGIYEAALIKELASLVEAIHAKGIPVCIQITHAGRKATRSIYGGQPVAPSGTAASDSGEAPGELEKHEIRCLVRLFGEATRRASKAGFKQAVKIPVIGVGGIKDPEFADQAIRQGRVDLVAIGRAILADPD
jgi:2,4-dienoyl-CoA reductase-like NADH-dependent reductase (Old Yellow Enzyme family)